MPQIIDYKLTEDSELNKLESTVKKQIKAGFQPLGPVTTTVCNGNIFYLQTLVKYGPTKRKV